MTITPGTDLARLVQRADNRARLAGHDLQPWERDGYRSAVTWCNSCSLALTVDSQPDNGDPRIDGSVAAGPCTHERGSAPTWAPQVPSQARAVA